ncbi:hypothetical protein Q5425_31710 [Amycolatopsis sp. A133]|uniref:hypothetical protein n=1 Tax=Amycolatopsis sp. A133 TaxID=3064472 RepID=UPI0027FA7F11|nr:hypothetical protein [Amycolatopsis sp. A133]MDQ7808324.1 hypothetical protein [Amycolatopsis sp. A133]
MTDPRSDDGVAVPWLAGLVLAGIGAGLAVVALTFPWISVRTDPRASSFTLMVTSIERQGPTFAVLLVLAAVGAVVAFAAARRRAGIRWLLVVVCAPLPALAALFVGLRANAADLGSSLPPAGPGSEQARPDLLVTPAQGLVFYTTGLLLVGLGVAIAGAPAAGRIPIATAAEPPSRRPPVVRLTALVLAVPLVVLSQALPWFEIDNPDNELPAVVTGWPGIYRAGLIAILVLLVGTALTAGWRREALRTAALYVCGGLYGVLLINAWLVWDPSGVADRLSAQRNELTLGIAYFAALAAVPLLALVVGPRVVEAPEEPEEPEAEAAAGVDAAPELEPEPEPRQDARPGLEPQAAQKAAGAEPAAESSAGPQSAAEPGPAAERKPATEPAPEPAQPDLPAASDAGPNKEGAEA